MSFVAFTASNTAFAGLSVFFQSSMYSVNENEGTVEVCIVLSTTSSEEVIVELDGADESASAGEP